MARDRMTRMLAAVGVLGVMSAGAIGWSRGVESADGRASASLYTVFVDGEPYRVTPGKAITAKTERGRDVSIMLQIAKTKKVARDGVRFEYPADATIEEQFEPLQDGWTIETADDTVMVNVVKAPAPEEDLRDGFREGMEGAWEGSGAEVEDLDPVFREVLGRRVRFDRIRMSIMGTSGVIEYAAIVKEDRAFLLSLIAYGDDRKAAESMFEGVLASLVYERD